MPGAIIESMSEADKMQFQIESAGALLASFAITTLTELANKFVIDVMHDKMRAANYSRKIIDRTYLAGIQLRGSEAFIHVTSDYTAENGFDVAQAREQGTKKHRIEPKNSRKSSVAGLSDGPQALAFIVNGKLVFSMGHDVSGIKASHIVRDTIIRQASVVEEKFHVRQAKFIASQIPDGDQIVAFN